MWFDKNKPFHKYYSNSYKLCKNTEKSIYFLFRFYKRNAYQESNSLKIKPEKHAVFTELTNYRQSFIAVCL